jgi:hypothetical protein
MTCGAHMSTSGGREAAWVNRSIHNFTEVFRDATVLVCLRGVSHQQKWQAHMMFTVSDGNFIGVILRGVWHGSS